MAIEIQIVIEGREVRSIFRFGLKEPKNQKNQGRWFGKKNVMPDHPFSGLLECGVCSASFYLVSGKGYYGCSAAYRKGLCKNNQMVHIKNIEAAILGFLEEKLKDPALVQIATKHYNKAVKTKLALAPGRLEQIDGELALVEGELKNLIQFVIQGNGSESINAAIKEREFRKSKLLSEANALKRSQPKIRERTEEEIKARFDGLSDAIQKHPLECYPAIRQMFPRKAKLFPKGKSGQGLSMYSMHARVLLNGGLTGDFERLIKNAKKKGGAEINLHRPVSCVSNDLGCDTLENGVTDPF